MITDILRFNRIGVGLLDAAEGETIDGLLSRHGFSEGFLEDYLLPMTGAIWSTDKDDIGSFPAEPMLRFLANHGLIQIVGRPQWRTVTGGSREYVRRLAAPLRDRIRLSSPVTRIERTSDVVIVMSRHGADEFDQVVIATHSDQALRLLADSATPQETRRTRIDPVRAESGGAPCRPQTHAAAPCHLVELELDGRPDGRLNRAWPVSPTG